MCSLLFFVFPSFSNHVLLVCVLLTASLWLSFSLSPPLLFFCPDQSFSPFAYSPLPVLSLCILIPCRYFPWRKTGVHCSIRKGYFKCAWTHWFLFQIPLPWFSFYLCPPWSLCSVRVTTHVNSKGFLPLVWELRWLWLLQLHVMLRVFMLRSMVVKYFPGNHQYLTPLSTVTWPHNFFLFESLWYRKLYTCIIHVNI